MINQENREKDNSAEGAPSANSISTVNTKDVL